MSADEAVSKDGEGLSLHRNYSTGVAKSSTGFRDLRVLLSRKSAHYRRATNDDMDLREEIGRLARTAGLRRA